MTMSRRERDAVDRVDRVLAQIGSLTPRNPADIQAIVSNLRIAVAAAKKAHDAVIELRYAEWDDFDRYMTEAERIIDPANDPLIGREDIPAR